LIGSDVGIGISSREKYTGTINQSDKISGYNDLALPAVDVRPRVEFISYYQHFGLSIGYSYKLTHYQSEMDGRKGESKSHYLRMGFHYCIN
jgi:hypothetical protein